MNLWCCAYETEISTLVPAPKYVSLEINALVGMVPVKDDGWFIKA